MPDDIRTYRITIEYTDAGGWRDHPAKWDWAELLTADDDESVRLIDAVELAGNGSPLAPADLDAPHFLPEDFAV